MEIQNGHFIRLKFHGPTNTRGARYTATWEGWPSDDGRPVRKSFPYDYRERDAVQQASEAFLEWLNAGSPIGPRRIDRITSAAMSESETAVIVHTTEAELVE